MSKVIIHKKFSINFNAIKSVSNQSMHIEKETGRKFKIVSGPIIVDRRPLIKQANWTLRKVADYQGHIIDLDGYLTDVSTAIFDFNHNNKSTGAKGLKTYNIDNYPIKIDDKEYLVKAKILEVKVYEDNMIPVEIDGKIENIPLLEQIQKGLVSSWSIQLSADWEDIEKMEGSDTEKEILIIKNYRTPYISFLNVSQGIPDAQINFIKNLDPIKLNNYNFSINNNNMPKLIHDAVVTKLSQEMGKEVTIDSLKLITTFVVEGSTKQYDVDLKDDGTVELSNLTDISKSLPEKKIDEEQPEIKKVEGGDMETMIAELKSRIEALETKVDGLMSEEQGEEDEADIEKQLKDLENSATILKNKNKNSNTLDLNKSVDYKRATQTTGVLSNSPVQLTSKENEEIEALKKEYSSKIIYNQYDR